MTAKVYVVTDLGPGDGGKGGVVHKIAQMMRAHTVIKVGGAQGSHGVRTTKGEAFAFSQWGCGTLDGIPSHISARMIISPEGLLNEAEALRYQCGIYDAFSLLTVDEEALCATPYHGVASRLKELARGNQPRGTVGTGVGEAYRYMQRQPKLAIKARDLISSDLRDRLAAVRQQLITDLQPLIDGPFLAGDQAEVEQELKLLHSDGALDYIVQRFQTVAKQTRIVGHDYLGEVILAKPGVAVVESSHGVLTDNQVGFHPHTSAIRTLPRFTHDMLAQAGYRDEIVNIGVTRAYAIRHGAGPMPTADPTMLDSLLPGSHKETNRYQGEVRVGPLDTVLLRYAVAACGGPSALNGLAVTWFDQIQTNKVWQLSNRYRGADDPALFTPAGEIRLSDNPSAERQALLGQKLSQCRPKVSCMPVTATSREELFGLCADRLNPVVGVPVRMVSFGPTEQDKLCK